MKIHKLADQEIQKIAAGQVVERPANALKELIENSLDAHATSITIEIEDGGKAHLTVIDNGHGMSEKDAKICFSKHTTSKLTRLKELETINTFGFRGEALASMCAVAKVSITTKETNNLEGLQLLIENGAVVDQKIVACQTGTTIQISDLFYNIPARKKFLKTTTTELNQCINLFKAYALNNYTKHFTLTHNNSVLYNCPATKTVQKRMGQLFEPSLIQNLIPLATVDHQAIKIEGVLTNHYYCRYDKNALFLFVNNRWVKNFQLINAIKKGYANVLPAGKHPAGSFHITIDKHLVDVNVHPKKEEVLFLNPRITEQQLTKSVVKSLEDQLSQQLQKKVELAPTKTAPFNDLFNDVAPFQAITDPFKKETVKQPLHLNHEFTNSNTEVYQQNQPKKEINTFDELTYQKDVIGPEYNFSVIGIYKKTYILVEKKEGLFFIDQHAAHERILYERFKKNYQQEVATVQLLFPETITFKSETLKLLKPHFDFLHNYGIGIEQIGPEAVAITATPVFMKNNGTKELLDQVIAWTEKYNSIDPHVFHEKITKKMCAQMACKAAVKAGDILSNSKIEQLIIDLEKTENKLTCPHSRPTTWLLSVHDIEKKFKRRL